MLMIEIIVLTQPPATSHPTHPRKPPNRHTHAPCPPMPPRVGSVPSMRLYSENLPKFPQKSLFAFGLLLISRYWPLKRKLEIVVRPGFQARLRVFRLLFLNRVFLSTFLRHKWSQKKDSDFFLKKRSREFWADWPEKQIIEPGTLRIVSWPLAPPAPPPPVWATFW